jgi:hypothetical protein
VYRQIDRPRAKIHDEGDHTGNEKEQQAKAVEGHDLPIDLMAMRLPAALRMDKSSAPRRGASSAASGKHEASLGNVSNEFTAQHRAPRRWTLRGYPSTRNVQVEQEGFQFKLEACQHRSNNVVKFL